MTDVMQAYSTAVTGETLWSEVEILVVFIGALTVFAFGFYLFRKLVKGAQRGKVRI